MAVPSSSSNFRLTGPNELGRSAHGDIERRGVVENVRRVGDGDVPYGARIRLKRELVFIDIENDTASHHKQTPTSLATD